MKKILILAALLLPMTGWAEDLRVAHVFSDHMVLQREAFVPIWGWGEPGKTVTVEASWQAGRSLTAKVAKDGKWRIDLETGVAGGPHALTIKSGKQTVTLTDVLLGEVWICAGQSNMEMPIGGFGFQLVEGAREAALKAGTYADKVRIIDIKTPRCYEPIDDIDASWKRASLSACVGTSAVAWFFATALADNLDVPVGIIVNPWGGSRIEAWMTREAIDASGITAEERAAIDAIEEHLDRWPETPELIWNGRMAPIAGYRAKGFIWYQGCSNMDQECYDKLQTSMVKLWREAWGAGDMPFIFALLAPYEHGDKNGRKRPHFIESQLRSLKTIPSSWAVSTETIGDLGTIHPAKKKEVGDMMALRALQSVYGQNLGFDIELPEPQSIEYLEDGRVKVTLTHVWSNLQSITARGITGFELAGEDRVFHLADAEVDWDGQTIYVQCAEVPHPIAVRYAFRNWMGADLQTSMGIPVPPFRTDDWVL
jgi:sialate O-acetylesterase